MGLDPELPLEIKRENVSTVVLRKRAQYQISAHPPLLLQFPAKV